VRRTSYCAFRCRKNTAAVFNVPNRILSCFTYHRSICQTEWLTLELCRDWAYSSMRITSLSPQKQTACVFFLHEYSPYMHSTEKYRSLNLFQHCSKASLGPTYVSPCNTRPLYQLLHFGNGKQVIANQFNGGVETAAVHLSAAALAGICWWRKYDCYVV